MQLVVFADAISYPIHGKFIKYRAYQIVLGMSVGGPKLT